MSTEITIAGKTFTVPSPYAEGHVLNAGEASQLNQVFHENIRNNMAKRVKEENAGQDAVDAYVASYSMGVRIGGGGRTRDPVKARALDIAREKVRAALKAKGKNLNAFKSAQISKAAEEALGKHPEWMDLARQQIADEQDALADIDVDSIPEKEPEAPVAA